eukprot:scaffold998_cov33-Phaeocystis_antarctica.AAC.1
MSDASRSPSGGDRAEAPGASHDSPSKCVWARHPFRCIVTVMPFRRARRARPAAIQPCPAPCALVVSSGERPRTSGMQPAAVQMTNGLVLDVRHAVAQLWASSADAVKAACGPHVPTGLVDEIDVLAWLTADVLGRPLLHADDTNAVGKRIAAHASRVEKRLRVEAESTRKTVGKARVAAAKKPELLPKVAAAEAAGEKARAVLLEK